MSKTVLMITGDYTEDYGSIVPFQTLRALGHTVHAVCPGKRAGEKIATAIREFDGAQTYTEGPGHRFTLNASFEDLVVEDYDALVISGGRAPEYLRLDDEVLTMVRFFFDEGRPVAAVSNGAQLLASAGVLAGRTCSAFPTCFPEVDAAGAIIPDIDLDEAVTDGNLVTAPAWLAHPAWLAQFIALLHS